MTSIAEKKSDLRTSAFAARKLAHAAGLDVAACKNLSRFIARQPGVATVAGYMPIRTEVDPLPVMAALVNLGYQVCVPVVQGEGQPLLFQNWTQDTPLIEGPFGAAVPKRGAFLTPDLLITPLVAFDARGFRLGYGGGYYDRSFELLRSAQKTIGVGFAYAAQAVDVVPTEPTDQKLNAVVTEREILAF